MKRSSLQWKLTLWFSAALVLMAVLTFIVVFFVSHSVLQKQLRTELIHTVEDNVDEVEFYRSIAQMDQDGDTDHYIRYGVGYLEIDDDFLDQVNGMITALYHENGSLLYGENPIAAAGMLAFEDGVCRTVRVRGETWYIFDRRLEQNTLRDLWLRGAVPETRADAPLRDIVYVCVWSLLALTLIAIAGGVLIARRALKPLRTMALTAAQISGGDDLKKRMPDGGSDELAQLAGAFNGMMQRLDDAFEAERQFASDASHAHGRHHGAVRGRAFRRENRRGLPRGALRHPSSGAAHEPHDLRHAGARAHGAQDRPLCSRAVQPERAD